VVKNGLEKIKTIGDAYMCAGGLPEDNDLHAEHAVKAALEMQQFLQEWNAERNKNKLPEFHARIGINTGALVAGVVGIKKFAYDIWGDTVNTASRIESLTKEFGTDMLISDATYQLVKDKVIVEPVSAKVKGKEKEEVLTDAEDLEEDQEVSIYWSTDKKWYSGTVKKISKKGILISYEDGEDEYIDEDEHTKIKVLS
jgi:class 3 adenylate cyclase